MKVEGWLKRSRKEKRAHWPNFYIFYHLSYEKLFLSIFSSSLGSSYAHSLLKMDHISKCIFLPLQRALVRVRCAIVLWVENIVNILELAWNKIFSAHEQITLDIGCLAFLFQAFSRIAKQKECFGLCFEKFGVEPRQNYAGQVDQLLWKKAPRDFLTLIPLPYGIVSKRKDFQCLCLKIVFVLWIKYRLFGRAKKSCWQQRGFSLMAERGQTDIGIFFNSIFFTIYVRKLNLYFGICAWVHIFICVCICICWQQELYIIYSKNSWYFNELNVPFSLLWL